MNKQNKDSVIFALFGDNEFISWTYGMFTQLVKYPKVYDNTQSQIGVVVKNAQGKITKLNKQSELGKIEPGFEMVDYQQNKEKEQLKSYKTFQLGIYYCNGIDLNEQFVENIKLNPDEKIDLVNEMG